LTRDPILRDRNTCKQADTAQYSIRNLKIITDESPSPVPLKITIYRKKKVREFPVRSRDINTKLSLGGNNDVITELFLPRGSLVSDIPAGDGKLVNLFLRCRVI
jgi:hypothetical protein